MPQWQPGQSGNPNGRPKSKPFREALRRAIAAAGDDRDVLKDVADSLVAEALSGDVQAIRELADRLDGKVAQPLKGDDEDGTPIAIQVVERVIVDPATD